MRVTLGLDIGTSSTMGAPREDGRLEPTGFGDGSDPRAAAAYEALFPLYLDPNRDSRDVVPELARMQELSASPAPSEGAVE